MTKEYNLSEKIVCVKSFTFKGTKSKDYPYPMFKVEDVKEFIKRLKEELEIQPEVNNFVQLNVLNQIINRLTGDLK